MVNPYVYPEDNESRWNWDSDTNPSGHGTKSSLQSLVYFKGLSAKLQRRNIEIF